MHIPRYQVVEGTWWGWGWKAMGSVMGSCDPRFLGEFTAQPLRNVSSEQTSFLRLLWADNRLVVNPLTACTEQRD